MLAGKLPPPNMREFCLRLKKNENIEIENQNWQSLNNLGLTPGVSRFYSNIKVTKTKQVEGFNVAAKWKKKFKGCACAIAKAGLFSQILVTFPVLSKLIKNASALKKCSGILRVAAII